MHATPKYVALADRLQRRWSALPAGCLVDSEHSIAAEFGVNRLTAREAIRELERRLIVRRIPGRGTVTAHRMPYSIDGDHTPSFRRVVTAAGYVPGVVRHQQRWVGEGDERHLRIRRVLSVDDLIAAVVFDRVPDPIGQQITGVISTGESIAEALACCGHTPRRDAADIELRIPPHPVARDLGYGYAPVPVWHLTSRTTDTRTASVIHTSQAWMRPEMFAVQVQLR
jgi:DNA-binding GntR family transcriptional regulator